MSIVFTMAITCAGRRQGSGGKGDKPGCLEAVRVTETVEGFSQGRAMGKRSLKVNSVALTKMSRSGARSG